MKVQWFSVLSVVGVVLLAGNSFGSELRWKKSVNSEAVGQSVTHIPTIITTDDGGQPPVISQVQQVVPVSPQMAPALAAQSDHYIHELNEYTDELRASQGQNPPSGATTIRNTPPLPLPGTTTGRVAPPLPSGKQTLVPCNTDQIGKSIKGVSHDIRPTIPGELPEECAIVGDPYYGRHFSQSCFMWKASALSTKAAYFEDAQLERHGHTKVCPALQPVVSGAKFFATVPILPYKAGVTPPNECVYTLGHYRMGSCAPYMAEPFPISPRGALFQAGAVAGAVVAVP